MADTLHAQLQARLDELARAEGLLVAETSRARIYRDRVGGTVAWMPHDRARVELTLIQIRMVSEARANDLHGLLVQCCERTTADIPSHDLGLDAQLALAHWDTLERSFFPLYLSEHRDVQSSQGEGARR